MRKTIYFGTAEKNYRKSEFYEAMNSFSPRPEMIFSENINFTEEVFSAWFFKEFGVVLHYHLKPPLFLCLDLFGKKELVDSVENLIFTKLEKTIFEHEPNQSA